MKTLTTLVITLLILASTSCSGQKDSIESFSNRNSCREINRLIGSVNDLINSYNNKTIPSLTGLAQLAKSFGELAKKTSNSELVEGIVTLEEGVRLMSSGETFLSGSQLFVGEIMPILIKCQNITD